MTGHRVTDGARNKSWDSTITRGVEPSTTAPGVETTIEELYSRVAPRLRRVAYLMVGRADVAEEIVHEAFVRTYHRLGSVDTPAAYLRTTVVNLCLAWRGRRALEQRHQPPGRTVVELPELDETWGLLSRLPRRQRAAVVLRYYEDLPFERIAAVIGCRPATVRSLVHRAIATLRKEMTP
jgi:RNA polymerase sigma factor (sigma-70 family)